jgi:DNA primase large subunit
LSIQIGTGDLAKYPFLNEASDYVKQTYFDLQEFDRPEMAHIIERASQRIEKEVSRALPDNVLDKYEIEILTFLVALILVRSIGVEGIVRKHSLFEAMRAEKFLSEDLAKERNEQKRRMILSKIFNELFKVNVEIDESNKQLFKVKVTDYLMRASQFHEQEWKLINRVVHLGFVYLDADETVRLIRSELSQLIYNKVKSMQISNTPLTIKAKADELKVKMASQFQFRKQPTKDYPPCITHALEAMNKGENLPHSARLMLATYTLGIGKTIDEIVEMFRNAPDFNERVTRYQIQHLAGLKGSNIKYSVPSCQKLLNQNLCYATDDCIGIINPMQFRKTNRSENGTPKPPMSRAS